MWLISDLSPHLTVGADFHELLALTGATKSSVIRLRIEGLLNDALTHLICQEVLQLESDLDRGVTVTIQAGEVRVRRLPMLTTTLGHLRKPPLSPVRVSARTLGERGGWG